MRRWRCPVSTGNLRRVHRIAVLRPAYLLLANGSSLKVKSGPERLLLVHSRYVLANSVGSSD